MSKMKELWNAEEKVKELTDLLEQLKAKQMETKDLVIQPPQQYR